MGFSKKHQVDESFGISMRVPLKTISTKKVNEEDEFDAKINSSGNTTPTGKGTRIPEPMTCPAPPRKRRPVMMTCHNNKEFFTSPDLDDLFKLFSKAN